MRDHIIDDAEWNALPEGINPFPLQGDLQGAQPYISHSKHVITEKPRQVSKLVKLLVVSALVAFSGRCAYDVFHSYQEQTYQHRQVDHSPSQ